METLKRALTEKETAAYLAMSVSYLKKARLDGHREGRTPGPPYVQIGRSVRYLVTDLDRWLEAHRCDVSQGVHV